MTLAALFSTAALALSMDASFADLDVNGDGQLSLEEVRAAAPDLTEAQFAEYDENGDGTLNEDEFNTWKDEKADESDDADDGGY